VDTAEPYELAMFPLGRVLFPSVVLPLHVFEPRYRELFATLVEDPDDAPHAAEFGVVLIERGSEVGGGDARSDVGTVAGVVQAEQAPDGRWGIVAVGVRRCRVVDWLDDDPWPRALVADWPDPPSVVELDDYTDAIAELRRALALATELGDDAADATVELSDDPSLGSYQLAALAPLGPADQQRLLAVEDSAQRIAAVRAAIADHLEMLEQRLALDGDADDAPDPDDPR
jgi:uncharacterized protein